MTPYKIYLMRPFITAKKMVEGDGEKAATAKCVHEVVNFQSELH